MFGALFTFVNISLIPRALGPVAYGNFDFLVTFFQQLTEFVDSGTSIFFFNKLSHRNADAGLIRTYAEYVVFLLLLTFCGLIVIWSFGWGQWVWPKQEWRYILLAALLGYLAWVSEILRKVVDAFGRTISGESLLLGLRGLGALAVAMLFWGDWLSLNTAFAKELVISGLVIIGLGSISLRYWNRSLAQSSFSSRRVEVLRELWSYCSPLLIYALVGAVSGIAGRWLLQHYAGPAEQGFYGLSFRVAAVSFLFTSAMTQLIMREFARAHGAGDTDELRRLFRRFSPLLYTLAAYFSSFICAQAETVVAILGGNKFAAASPALMIMALSPMHQTYGQMNGSLLFATGQTSLYRNIGILSMVLGLVSTWFILAPKNYGGLAGGSLGLALNLVAVQFFAVNLQLWFNAKRLQLNFRLFLLHQIVVAALFVFLAWGSSSMFSHYGLTGIANFMASGFSYSLLVALCIWRVPRLIGWSRADFKQLTF